MARILTPKAKVLHSEAQKRYLSRLQKKRIPTTEILLRTIGRSAIAVSVAQTVNTEDDGKMVARAILQGAVRSLVATGYDQRESVLRLQRILSDARLLQTAAEAAQDGCEVDHGASPKSYSPGA